jgi:hypothetical protein
MTSPKVVARVAGALYLLASVCFVLAIAARAGITRAGDASATAASIRASASLYRAALVGDLVSSTLFLLTAIALYALLSHVHRLIAATMVLFVVVLVTVVFVNDVNLYNALTIATDPTYARAFGVGQSAALVTLFTGAHAGGLAMDELYFGLWLLPLGYLVLRSGQFPRLVGVLLIVAGVDWIGQFLADLMAPGLPYVAAIGQVCGIGEVVFVAWLLIAGIRLPVGRTQDTAVAAGAP